VGLEEEVGELPEGGAALRFDEDAEQGQQQLRRVQPEQVHRARGQGVGAEGVDLVGVEPVGVARLRRPAQRVLQDQPGGGDVAPAGLAQQRVEDGVEFLCGEPIEQALPQGGDLAGVGVAGAAAVTFRESSLAVAALGRLGDVGWVEAAHAVRSVRSRLRPGQIPLSRNEKK
jgi:hypothetical protein